MYSSHLHDLAVALAAVLLQPLDHHVSLEPVWNESRQIFLIDALLRRSHTR